jgi:hypothetical protein
VPASLQPDAKTRLEAVARACPVVHSLAPGVEKHVEFLYTE